MIKSNVFVPKFTKNDMTLNKVVDGDGMILKNIFNKYEEEIRFLGIDAPELKPCRKLNQDDRETHIAGSLLIKLGWLSFNYLKDLVPYGTKLSIIMDKANDVDLYGRTLAYVYLPDGRCLNEIMIAEGYAKPYSRFYCSELKNYQILNMKAKNEKKGLYEIVDNF